MHLLRVLVIGGSGFIGRYLVRRLGEASRHDIRATYRSRPPPADGNSWRWVELTDTDALAGLFRQSRPEVVVHLAAMADVGACEREPGVAAAVNVDATSAIARLSQQHGARLVFVSTEYVFDGSKGFHAEDDAPSPNTHYGRTKHDAEQAVADLGDLGAIVRTSIVYGWPLQAHRNFAPWLIERLRSGQPYHGATGVLRTPVYVEHLVDGIVRLVEKHHAGIHHIAGRDWVSMCDFAQAVAEGFGLDHWLVIPDESAVNRGAGDRLGLNCARTMQRLGLGHPGLMEGIAAMQEVKPP